MSEDLGAKLSRWSQRKLAARRGVTVEEAEETRGEGQPVTSEQQVPAAAPSGADQVAEPAEGQETPVLPPIDELTAESDYSVFLGKNVPQALTNAALRKLWLSDPVLANLDRLNDYDEDYSIVESVVSAVRTSYRVGKGYVEEVEKTVAKLEPSDGGEDNTRAESSVGSNAVDSEATGGTRGNSDAPEDESGAASRHLGATDLGDVESGQVVDKDN